MVEYMGKDAQNIDNIDNIFQDYQNRWNVFYSTQVLYAFERSRKASWGYFLFSTIKDFG